MSLGKIAIVGAGAVGSYYGARLAQAGENVTFLLRSDYQYIREKGLKVRSINGDFHLEHVACTNTPEAIGEVDLIIIAWKATANASFKETLTPLVGKNTLILTLQNGLGNAEALAQLFGADRVLAGLCFVCINRLSPGVISHTAAGLIRIGEYSSAITPRLEKITQTFQKANFPCEAVPSLEKALWMKLVWNYPFNGLAIAEGGVDTEVLLKERKLEPLIRSIMEEVTSVAAALGHEIPTSFIDKQIEITYPMKKYRPSSMIDFIEGRPVEYDAIWEKPLKIAAQLEVDVPQMTRLAERIKTRLK